MADESISSEQKVRKSIVRNTDYTVILSFEANKMRAMSKKYCRSTIFIVIMDH